MCIKIRPCNTKRARQGGGGGVGRTPPPKKESFFLKFKKNLKIFKKKKIKTPKIKK